MNYNFTINYPNNRKPISVRQVLNELLIPRKWQHLLRINKQVLINNRYRNFNQLVLPNDKIMLTFDFIESEQQRYPASGLLPEIIYEDENVLVINKKKGQKTHPNLFETDTALNDCATYLRQAPFIVHRLDMLTGGLLLVAKNPAVVPILNRQLVCKTFKRDYLAEVKLNKELLDQGSINFPIGQDPNDQRKRIVSKNGQNALTHYQIVSKDKKRQTAIIKLSLSTGRTHQIRVHLSALGCPIIGDPLYNPDFKDGEELQLTAYKMSFVKPYSFETQEIYLK